MDDALPPEGQENPFNGESQPDLHRGERKKSQLNVDRLPPHSMEAEQASVGCMLIDPTTCVPLAVAVFGGNSEAYYDLRHQIIYAAIGQMFANGKPVDVITLGQRLSDFDLLDQVGGWDYLNGLPDLIASSANMPYYLDIIKSKWLLRRMMHACSDALGRVYTHEGEVDDLLDSVEREVLNVRRDSVESKDQGMVELVIPALARIEEIARNKKGVTGIATGFTDYDLITGGMQAGEMIVIAARPSIGKTSLALNIADFVAVKSKIPVGVFSLEMTKESLTERMIYTRARVNSRRVRQGDVTEGDFKKMAEAATALSTCPLRIDDTSGLSIMQLRARARSMFQQYGIKLFVIDYLQLLHSETKRAKDSRQQEVSDISNGIKGIAKELKVPVIALSQLNRDLEKTKRRPGLHDLRESGSLEQDADVVGLLYHPEMDDPEAAKLADFLPVYWDIGKSRNGPCGIVELTFLKSYTRFESAARVSDDDVPPGYKSPYVEDSLPFSTTQTQ